MNSNSAAALLLAFSAVPGLQLGRHAKSLFLLKLRGGEVGMYYALQYVAATACSCRHAVE